MKWFKHYNESSDGHLVGNLLAEKNYPAVCLWWLILELVSRFEDDAHRGKATIPLSRIARIMNMKQSRTAKLLDHIAFVSQSDLKCTITSFQPRYVSFELPNWLKLQETRGGKKRAKSDQSAGRRKMLEVRSKKGDYENSNPSDFANQDSPPLNPIFEIWNKHRASLPEALLITKKRKKLLDERWHENPNEEFWAECVKKLASSRFCLGENDRGWRANLDFLLRPDTCMKLLEGTYDNKIRKDPMGMKDL